MCGWTRKQERDGGRKERGDAWDRGELKDEKTWTILPTSVSQYTYTTVHSVSATKIVGLTRHSVKGRPSITRLLDKKIMK